MKIYEILRSLVKGFSYVSLCPRSNIVVYMPSPGMSDAEAIACDWEQVGNDLEWGIRQFRKENNLSQS